MSKTNYQSLAFALTVLILALFSRNESAEIKTPVSNAIEATSLTANVAQTANELVIPAVKTNIVKINRNPAILNTAPAALSNSARILTTAKPETKTLAPVPAITAQAVLVKDLDAEAILLQKNSSQRWPMASLTKLMTAIAALENLSREQKVVITVSAAETPGETNGFKTGEIYSVIDLIKAAVIASSNDAAMALAEFYGYPEFINLMQAKAGFLSMTNTTFSDPTGLSVLNQTTAGDLEKLTEYILANHPEIFEISAQREALITEINSQTAKRFLSTNKFAGEAKFLGGKTGYTDDASGNLLTILRSGSRRYLIIVFGTSDRFGETEKLYNWAKQ